MTANGKTQIRTKPSWLAWTVSIGEAFLLLAVGFVLSRYWLMLPVWMRRTAGIFLAIALAIVAYRLFQFIRNESAMKRQLRQCSRAPDEVA